MLFVTKVMEQLIFKFKSLKSVQLFTISIRYLLGSAFVWASILKIKGVRFTPAPAESSPIDSLPHLVETMYRSGFYWQFIGWSQCVAGLLIMSQTFSTLGAAVYFPMMLSIFVLTTYFDSLAVLSLTSLMLAANLYLLLWDYNRFKFIILANPGEYADQTTAFSKHKIWAYIGVLLCLAIVILRLMMTTT